MGDKGRSCFTVFGVVLVIAVIISAILYFVDSNTYKNASQAMERGDCTTALPAFDQLIREFRLVPLGDFKNRAAESVNECKPFEEAVTLENTGKISASLVAFDDFVTQKPGSVLVKHAQARMAKMLKGDAASVASENTCGQLKKLVASAGIGSSEEEGILPGMYAACGDMYAGKKDEKNSYEMFHLLLAQYPQHKLAGSAETALLNNQHACSIAKNFYDDPVLNSRGTLVPRIYFSCADRYQKAEETKNAYELYYALLAQYPTSSESKMAEEAIINGYQVCNSIKDVSSDSIFLARNDMVPRIYKSCGEQAVKRFNDEAAYDSYLLLLNEYPNHALARFGVEGLRSNKYACTVAKQRSLSDVLKNAKDVIADIYVQCGESLYTASDYSNAISVYERFLDEYPGDSRVEDVSAKLAQALISDARGKGAGTIETPNKVGDTASGTTIVEIQNDSPNRMRIVFTGPVTKIYELDQCAGCTVYNNIGPMYCPEKGPVGRYELPSGKYDVLVESIGDETIPFTGNWDLSGDYFSCFFIVRTSY